MATKKDSKPSKVEGEGYTPTSGNVGYDPTAGNAAMLPEEPKEFKIPEKAFIASCCKDFNFNTILDSKAETIYDTNNNNKVIGYRRFVEEIGVQPLDSNVILRGITIQQMLTLSNTGKLDDNSTFEYTVVGLGEHVIGLSIGDKVAIPFIEGMSKLDIKDNDESLEKIRSYYKGLVKTNRFNPEVEDYKLMQHCKERQCLPKIRMVEYFLVSRHSIAAILTK